MKDVVVREMKNVVTVVTISIVTAMVDVEAELLIRNVKT